MSIWLGFSQLKIKFKNFGPFYWKKPAKNLNIWPSMYPSLTYIANLDMMTFTWHCVIEKFSSNSLLQIRGKKDDSTLKNVFLLTWKSNPQMTEREIITNEKTSFAAFSPPPLEWSHIWINVKHSQPNVDFCQKWILQPNKSLISVIGSLWEKLF